MVFEDQVEEKPTIIFKEPIDLQQESESEEDLIR